MTKTNVRKGNWDFAKAMLMLVIIYGHVCPASADRWNYSCRLAGLFVIPAFFFISGYFQSRIGSVKDMLAKLKRAFMRITVPQMAWGAIYVAILVAIKWSTGEFHRETLLADIVGFVKYSPFYVMGIFWFLTALQLCIVVGTLMSYCVNRFGRAVNLLLALSMVCFCLMPTEVAHFSFIWFFYSGGMLYRQYEDLLKRLMPGKVATLAMLIVMTVAVLYVNLSFYPADSFYGASNLLKDSTAGFILMRFAVYSLATVTALGWLMLAYYALMGRTLTRLLESWGRDTLFVYCSHVLLLTFLYFPYKASLIPDGGMAGVALVCLASLTATVLLYVFLEWLIGVLKRSRVASVLLMGDSH